MDDFASIINEQLKQLKEAVQKRGRVNLLVAGKTGVGKSTLINAVFQGNFASTGSGRPVTKSTRKIKKKGVPLRALPPVHSPPRSVKPTSPPFLT